MKPNRKNLLLAAISLTLTAQSAFAVDFYWDGANANWSTITAWSTTAAGTTDPGAAPASSTTSDLFFNRTANNASSSNVTFAGGSRLARSMTFSTSGTTLFRANSSGTTTARTLTLGAGGITLNSTAGTVTIGDTPGTYGAINVAMGASQIWTNDSASVLTAQGVVSGTGFDLTKNGTGQIRLNGANTYSGATIINDGILTIGNYAGLNNTSAITLSGGTAILQLVQVGTGTTTNTISQNVSLNGTIQTGGGSGTNRLNLTWGGDITLTGDSKILNNGNSLIDVDGQIDLAAHTLTFQTDGTGSRIDGDIIGAGGSLNKTNPQGLILTGTNTYTGTTTMSGGTLTTSLPANLAGYTNSGKVIFDGGRLNISTGDGSTTGWTAAQVSTLLSNATKTSGNLGVTVANGDVTLDSSTDFAGLGLIKAGANTLTLDQAYSQGATTIGNNGGTLKITTAAALGAGAVTIQTSGSNTGTLDLALTGTNTITNTFNGFSSANTLTGTGNAQILNTSGNNEITSNLTVTGTGGSGLNVESDGGLLTLSGTITSTVSAGGRVLSLGGSGDGVVTGAINNDTVNSLNFTVTKSGSGTWTIANATNSYAGVTTVAGGSLIINGAIASTSVVVNGSLGGSGTMANATLSGSGSINPGNSPGIMTVAATDPTGGLDYNFEFTAANTDPTWSNAMASVNDALRLTSATPFTASLGGTNTVSIYLNVASFVENDVFTGGFYTDNNTAFLASISSADFDYYIADPLGTAYNGVNYSLYTGPLGFNVNTIQVASADFAGGTITNGYVTQFTVVPEPSTALLGGLGLLALLRRRR